MRHKRGQVMKPEILQMTPFMPEIDGFLHEHFKVHRLPQTAERHAFFAQTGPRIRGIATTAVAIIGDDLFEQLPALRIVACQGAGLDNIDVAAAKRRGIRVTGTSKILAAEVADIAIALTLNVTRRLCEADRFVRAGRWPKEAFPLGHTIRGRKLGVIGLGNIGTEVALRATAFGMIVGYTASREKAGLGYPYFSSAAALADWADVLVVACPGGPATRHLVDRAVLKALGENGWLINIARGSVVDEAALVDALAAGRIAGAGLDVFEHEPSVPVALISDERVVLLPHIASAARETRIAMGRAMVESIDQELCR